MIAVEELLGDSGDRSVATVLLSSSCRDARPIASLGVWGIEALFVDNSDDRWGSHLWFCLSRMKRTALQGALIASVPAKPLMGREFIWSNIHVVHYPITIDYVSIMSIAR